MLLLTFWARMNNPSFEDGNGLRLCRVRFQSISLLTAFPRNERTHDFDPCTGSHARRSHRPAVRRLHIEGAHELMTVTQHPLPHPLVGPSTVIIEVIMRACAVSSASAHERRR